MASASASSAMGSRAASAADDSDLDPAAFLKSVRELSERREREDAERYRKLEEEIEKGRQERAIRRADRARSISPAKGQPPTATSAASTPTRALRTQPVAASIPPLSSPRVATQPATDAEIAKQPTPATDEVPDFKGFGSTRVASPALSSTPVMASPAGSPSSPKPPSAASLARSGTLSWQQRRPTSRLGESRPQSVVMTGSSSPAINAGKDGAEPSRDQIAASLGARDPSWFKQTAERGMGNAAFRKSKEEVAAHESMTPTKRGLAGMSRPLTVDAASNVTGPLRTESPRPDFAPQIPSARESFSPNTRFSADRASASGPPDLKALIAADESQVEASPMTDRQKAAADNAVAGQPPPSVSAASLSSQTRLASNIERPSSPTKGMGGFVHSAMMKRSDSVNKRWSAQPGTLSLSRQNSLAAISSGHGGLAGSHSMPRLEPLGGIAGGSKDNSVEPDSGPSGSGNDATAMPPPEGRDTFVKPARSHHTRSKSVASNYSTTAEEMPSTPPLSPGKRFSPHKSTWLESAISRPESPKPATPARNSQPSWMVDIAKAKAQRASGDVTPRQNEGDRSRSASPSKATFGQTILRRTESRDLGSASGPSTPILGARPLMPAETPTRAQPVQLESVRGRSSEPRVAEAPTLAARPAAKSEDVAQLPSQAPKVAQAERADIANVAAAPKTATAPKAKPETPPKPQTDFRANLRSRPAAEGKKEEAPEFLSKFGNLRKATTQNYVAPDILKANIARGKADLTKSAGPIKTQRTDELKDSLLAKKDQWKTEKEQGIVHEHKTGAPIAPQKPEGLLQRDLLGRSETVKQPAAVGKPKPATPEALARHQSMKEAPPTQSSMPLPQKQGTASLQAPRTGNLSFGPPATSPTETSKLAAKFNPGLAGFLARGPPAATSGSNGPSRTESPVQIDGLDFRPTEASNDPPPVGAPLEDMRKGRAKGPKKRAGGAAAVTSSTAAPSEPTPLEMASRSPSVADVPLVAARAQAPSTSASVMLASLKNRGPPGPIETSAAEQTPSVVSSNGPNAALKPSDKPTPSKSPSAFPRSAPTLLASATTTPAAADDSVAEFKGFGSLRRDGPLGRSEDDKENDGRDSPSVKTAASNWNQKPTSRSQTPIQIQLPSRKDEEAAMRSASLLASSPTRPSSRDGLGIVLGKANGRAGTPPLSGGLPPKPAKSSRVVSGQLLEASPNKEQAVSHEVELQLSEIFGFVPHSSSPLTIDTQALVSNVPHQERVFRTVRRNVHVLTENGSLRQLRDKEDYTFFDESVHVCTHAYTVANGPKKTEIFLWAGSESSQSSVDQAQTIAKKQAKEAGNAFVHTIRQDYEPPGFIQALGGILVTRRGSRSVATRQYMLCGRKHLGQIVFDEVDFSPQSLCPGFAYIISSPVTLQDTKVYVWKGAASSADEVSAARLAAMDLSETSDVIEVDGGAEFASFLKVFGPGTTKAALSGPSPSPFWSRKALAPAAFAPRLFRLQPAEAKPGMFANIFARRPSWSNLSPGRRQQQQQQQQQPHSPHAEPDIPVEARELSPFTQADLDPDAIYLLDGHAELLVLAGPLFAASNPDPHAAALLAQTLLLAASYAAAVAPLRPDGPPPAAVLLRGQPPDYVHHLFRRWDGAAGLWGTGSLMAGVAAPASAAQARPSSPPMPLPRVIQLVCRGSGSGSGSIS